MGISQVMEVTREVLRSSALGRGLKTVLIHHLKKNQTNGSDRAF